MATSDSDPAAVVERIKDGYTFTTPAIDLGVLIQDGQLLPEVKIRIPLEMMNRHGLIAGATGTGKTKTLQLMAEQLSAAGIPVFAADIKGDLSGIVSPGEPNDKLTERTKAIGQDWQPRGYPTQYLALGGQGTGVPLRATVSAFGPLLLSKVLGLNDTQSSSLGLVFHYADQQGLALLDLEDLVAVLKFLTGPDGKADLADIGGVSSQTAGVILRSIVNLSDQGGDVFFGEPEFDPADLLAVAGDGRGVISVLELPNLQDRPALFSTFLMWLLADLFHTLPEVGDSDKPKLVFFFDEAHLLFDDASKAFINQITQTVRLIRSKGVGVFFVTQMPTDVPNDVLAQLGSRVQHQLRSHTPNDAKALKATVNTYPTSQYDLVQVLQNLGIGEAIVTVMDAKGAPTPVAWTRMQAPTSLMGPADPTFMEQVVASCPIEAKYATPINRESAAEILTAKLNAGAQAAQAEAEAKAQAQAEAAAAKAQAQADAAAARAQQKADAAAARAQARVPATPRPRATTPRPSMVEQAATSAMRSFSSQMGRTLGNAVVRSLFGTARRG